MDEEVRDGGGGGMNEDVWDGGGRGTDDEDLDGVGGDENRAGGGGSETGSDTEDERPLDMRRLLLQRKTLGADVMDQLEREAARVEAERVEAGRDEDDGLKHMNANFENALTCIPGVLNAFAKKKIFR